MSGDSGHPLQTQHESADRSLFDRIAGQYCRKDLSPACRIARRHRLMRTVAGVGLTSVSSILEAGCGAGFSARYLRGLYEHFAGIDYSQQLIDCARHYNGGDNVVFEAANIRTFQTERRFDVILMVGVLHHLDDMPGAMARLVGLLRPGGWLVANEPSAANPLIRLARAVRKRLDRAYSDEQLQLSAGQLRELFTSAGLTDVRICPQGLLSTPFAEVILRPQVLMAPLSAAACAIDTALETVLGRLLRPLCWNLIAAGRKPAT